MNKVYEQIEIMAWIVQLEKDCADLVLPDEYEQLN